MLGTQPYPTLPYQNPEPNTEPTPPRPTPLNTTPTPYTYPTLPPPHPTPTLLLSCHTPPCPALPYPTLPYPSAVYVGPFRCFGSSVVHFGLWVRFDPFVPFRFVSVH